MLQVIYPRNTIWLAINPDMSEVIFSERPIRGVTGGNECWKSIHSEVIVRHVPKGTISLIIGAEVSGITWSDEPIEVECHFDSSRFF